VLKKKEVPVLSMTYKIQSTLTNKRHLVAAVLAILIIGYTTVPAFAQQASQSFSEPLTIHASVTATDCSNAPGPYITLSGPIGLGKVDAKFTFENNLKGTHTFTDTSTITANVIPAGTSIQIPKQPVLGGVGGNPYIYLQFVDSNGNPLTGEYFLGRCVQGLSDVAATVSIPSTLNMDVSALDCSNKASTISLSGSLVLSGLDAKIIFRNNVKGTHENDQSVTANIIPSGTSITFPKQPSLGGVGGNPWIFLQFLDENGTPIGNTIFLGRCVQNF